ncbi:MAG: GH32 C-terminal domain-containing protein, partial [Clostridia bacterium]|nr:GH32 C-terminal domain-containing protein [Clostridia bacterium]
ARENEQAVDTGMTVPEKKMQYIPKQQVLPNLIPEDPYKNAQQMELLPKERVISEKARKQYRLIGSIFNTYWMFSYQDKLYFVDQHAAHEKVNYEKLVRQYKAHQVYTQQLNPPIIVSLSPSETETLEAYQEHFAELGFTIEAFGGTEYAISTIPLDLYRKEPKTLFLEILNELSLKGVRQTPNIIDRVLATMACKASVKGGDVISMQEMDAVLDELLSLENVTMDEANQALEAVSGDLLYIKAVLEPQDQQNFGLTCKAQGRRNYTSFTYYTAKGTMDGFTSNRAKDAKASVVEGEVPLKDGKLTMEIFIDRSLVEGYFNSDKAISVRSYADFAAQQIKLFADGEVQVDELKVYTVSSIYQ